MDANPANGSQQVIIQATSDETLTLKVNGEVREIKNRLEELKALLVEKKVQSIQYADKIYNIGHIDHANFGFITGKRAFNERLTRQLVEAIQPGSRSSQIFLERVAAIPQWETQSRICDKAKEIIAYSFPGVIGIQLSKLMAIGKEDFSEAKQRKYIERCIQIVKYSLDLLCFVLLSKLLDESGNRSLQLSDEHKNTLRRRLNDAFEPSLEERLGLLRVLCVIFANPFYSLVLPLPELTGFDENLQETGELRQTCQQLQAINDKLDKTQYDLLDCFESENLLAMFLRHFHFLINYRMASIKHIGYRQIRNENPYYLHRYTALGIDNKANVDAEKINYTGETVHTEAVLLYRGENYRDNINLFPFVIDYNTLTLEQGSKICFYLSRSIAGDSLEYRFLEDNSIVLLERKASFPPPETDFNELLLNNENRKTLNLNCTVDQFREARRRLLGDELNFDDI